MELHEMISLIRNDLDKSSLSEIMLATMDGWTRVCPSDELHIMSLPRKNRQTEQWLFEQVRNLIVEYSKME